MSQNAFCKEQGLLNPNITAMLEGSRPFTEKTARKLEKILKLALGHFDRDTAKKSSTKVAIPIYDIKLSAGSGCDIYSQEPIDTYEIESDAITRRGWYGEKLCIFSVKGDSMEHFIVDGQQVLVHTNEQNIIDGKVYAICINDEVYIKYLFRDIRNNKIMARPENNSYPEFHLNPNEFSIIGRVVMLMAREI